MAADKNISFKKENEIPLSGAANFFFVGIFTIVAEVSNPNFFGTGRKRFFFVETFKRKPNSGLVLVFNNGRKNAAADLGCKKNFLEKKCFETFG